MRWNKPKESKYKIGEMCTFIKFAWYPKRMRDYSWVWLEKYKVVIEFRGQQDGIEMWWAPDRSAICKLTELVENDNG